LPHTLFLILKRKIKLGMTKGVKRKDIKLPDLLNEEYIELDLKAKEKSKLIPELVDIVIKSSRKKDGVLFKLF